MDSVNRNQAADPRTDLNGTQAIERIRDVVYNTVSRFFCTAVSRGGSDAVKPTSVPQADDARITALAFSPTSDYYSDNRHNDAVAGIKMTIGTTLGKTLDDPIEGKVLP